MEQLIKQAMHIRYTKLHFTIAFLEDSKLPPNKHSAIRGGIGEMLLQANCIRDRRCEQCDFKGECIVQRTMYTQFKEKPAYMTNGESVGYVLECENNQEYFRKGEYLEFVLLLFGKNLVYFSQYLQAVCALGAGGLGKYRARFQVISVRNENCEELLSADRIHMERYRISYLDEYVERQLILRRNFSPHRIVFVTPLTLKFRGEFRNEFHIEAILSGIRRRIYMLDCFEEIQNEEWMRWKLPEAEITGQHAILSRVDRYSSRKGTKMTLYGLTGDIYLKEMSEDAKILLLAGELIHVGKNTSFGFGKYQLID